MTTRPRAALVLLLGALAAWAIAERLGRTTPKGDHASAASPSDVREAPPVTSGDSRWVDPFIGTAGAGLTVPGAFVPWGMVSASPQTSGSRDRSYERGRPIVGFGQLHFSGSPPELGLVLLSALSRAPDGGDDGSPPSIERAGAGYYAARFPDHTLVVEATATIHTTLYRFTYGASAQPRYLSIDVGYALGLRAGDRATGAITSVSTSRIEGWARGGAVGGLGGPAQIFFCAEVDHDASESGRWSARESSGREKRRSTPHGAWWRFDARDSTTLLVRIGLSYVDIAGARNNLTSEQPVWSFDATRDAAARQWDDALSRIHVDGGSDSDRRIFYTALYHALLHPSVFSDTDGRYRRFVDGSIGQLSSGRTRYTGFSLWDTYRTVHPLLAFVYPERAREMIQSLVDARFESGWLPLWELAGQEANNMVGDPATIVIAEAYLKGIARDDATRAYEALRDNAVRQSHWREGERGSKARVGLREYERLGYVPEQAPDRLDTRLARRMRNVLERWRNDDSRRHLEQADVYGSVSTTQEYAHADACVASFARRLGRVDDARHFEERSHGYRRLFDAQATWTGSRAERVRGFFRPRKADGEWAYAFAPSPPGLKPHPQRPGFVEGDEWTYLFNASHDIPGLVQGAGSRAELLTKLDRYFSLGAYDGSNEGPLAYPYLFARLGSPEGTQALVPRLRRAEYSAREDGLPGEDDAGTLSAWFVWSALGLYPFEPCEDSLAVGTPLFPHVHLQRSPAETGAELTADSAPARFPSVRAVVIGGARRSPTMVGIEELWSSGGLRFLMSSPSAVTTP